MPTYYAQKDANGFPIPGTMMSTTGTVPSAANIVTIAAADAGTTAASNGLVYTVAKDSSGNIVPNTLRTYYKKPENVYEHKKS